MIVDPVELVVPTVLDGLKNDLIQFHGVTYNILNHSVFKK